VTTGLAHVLEQAVVADESVGDENQRDENQGWPEQPSDEAGLSGERKGGAARPRLG
jgi:hypothetical protein